MQRTPSSVSYTTIGRQFYPASRRRHGAGGVRRARVGHTMGRMLDERTKEQEPARPGEAGPGTPPATPETPNGRPPEATAPEASASGAQAPGPEPPPAEPAAPEATAP